MYFVKNFDGDDRRAASLIDEAVEIGVERLYGKP